MASSPIARLERSGKLVHSLNSCPGRCSQESFACSKSVDRRFAASISHWLVSLLLLLDRQLPSCSIAVEVKDRWSQQALPATGLDLAPCASCSAALSVLGACLGLFHEKGQEDEITGGVIASDLAVPSAISLHCGN